MKVIYWLFVLNRLNCNKVQCTNQLSLCFSISFFLHTVHPAQGQCIYDADMSRVPLLLVMYMFRVCLLCVYMSLREKLSHLLIVHHYLFRSPITHHSLSLLQPNPVIECMEL